MVRPVRTSAGALLVALVSLIGVLSIPASAEPLGSITEFTEGLSRGLYSITPGPDGNLWFTGGASPTPGPRIGRITPSGNITEFTQPVSPSSAAYGITAGPDGNLWFTQARIYSGGVTAIGRMTPSGAAVKFSAGLNSGALPEAITRGPDGNLWFTDAGTTRAIGRITPSGTITEFSTGLHGSPWFIAAGPDGNLWFTEQGTLAIGRITPTGTITEFSAGLGGYPVGIAPGPDGNLWFAEQNGGLSDPDPSAIGRITPTGTITEFSDGLGTASSPAGIALGADGNLWFADPGNGPTSTPAVGQITPSGAITPFSEGLTDMAHPEWIAPGPDGNLWFTESVNDATGAQVGNAIGRVGTGAPAALVNPPSVVGTGEQGTQHTCQGDTWATWAGQQPQRNSASEVPPGVQWLRDGAPLTGQTNQAYTPVAADVGHALTCTVAVTYPMLLVTETGTSEPVTVLPSSPSPTSHSSITGRRAAALKKCKKYRKGTPRRRRCVKKANKRPV